MAAGWRRPRTTDGVTYFVDALERSWILLDHGVIALARNLIGHPPHAPNLTVAAVAGFLFGGVAPTGAAPAGPLDA